MKKLIAICSITVLLLSCNNWISKNKVNIPSTELADLITELKAENIVFEVVEKKENKSYNHRLNILFINIKNDKTDLLYINKIMFQKLNKHNFHPSKFDQIVFYYYTDYDNAKVKIIYFYNSEEKLDKIAYR